MKSQRGGNGRGIGVKMGILRKYGLAQTSQLCTKVCGPKHQSKLERNSCVFHAVMLSRALWLLQQLEDVDCI